MFLIQRAKNTNFLQGENIMSQITPQRQKNVIEVRFIRYGVAILSAVFVGIIFFLTRLYTSYTALNIPLWKESAPIVISFILGYVGFIVGDVLRQWVMPSHLIAKDFIKLVKMKIFWKIGPQSVGIVIGCVAPWIVFYKLMMG